MGYKILTYTGKILDLSKPSPDLVDVRDVAHALSMTCRWGGHCRDFYSVAEHSVLACALAADTKAALHLGPLPLRDEELMVVLMHDAHEAYVGDVTRPLKALLPDYREVEEGWRRAVALRFKLAGGPEIDKLVKEADEAALAVEYATLFDHGGLEDCVPRARPYHPSIQLLDPVGARAAFLSLYHQLRWEVFP